MYKRNCFGLLQADQRSMISKAGWARITAGCHVIACHDHVRRLQTMYKRNCFMTSPIYRNLISQDNSDRADLRLGGLGIAG